MKRPTVLIIIFLVVLYGTLLLIRQQRDSRDIEAENALNAALTNHTNIPVLVPQQTRTPFDPIMSKMGNETQKAELGRAAWRLLHTMATKFPYEPSESDRQSLLDFIYLFAKLYPCGDCARHFKEILADNPPDATNRDTISQWTCKVHNLVNKRLQKPEFDCSKVGDMWKCGCAEDDKKNPTKAAT